jgi:hypothetical protein
VIAVMRMLARGASRRERVRGRLVIAGAALATFLFCAAVILLQVEGRLLGDFMTADGRAITALGMAVLIVPVMTFVYQVSRLTSASKERRLAALRLAGATPRHVRLIGAYESCRRALLGALGGVAVFAVADLALWQALDGALPLISPALAVTVVVTMAIGGTLTGLKAGRYVVTSPLGVTRRVGPTGPRALDLVLVAGGIGAFAVGMVAKGRFPLGGVYGMALTMVAGLVLLLFGLVLATAWLIRAVARRFVRRARAAETLLAARLVEADPRGWARTLTVVGLAVFFGSAEGGHQSLGLAQGGFSAGQVLAYLLVDVALLIALATSVAALVVHQAEELLDHRRAFAVLAASGAPEAALGRVLIHQALMTAIPVCAVSAIAGAAIVIGTVPEVYAAHPAAYGWVAALAIVMALIGVLTALLVARSARPFLRRGLHPDELRTA